MTETTNPTEKTALTEKLGAEGTRSRVIDDCMQLVETEVQKKKGLGGMVIKTGYKAVKGVKPGFVRKVVDSLFDRWAAELGPMWQEAIDDGKDPRKHLAGQRSRVADALLLVTDEKSQRADNAMVSSTYKKLRPSAKKHVEEAVPGLLEVLERHANS